MVDAEATPCKSRASRKPPKTPKATRITQRVRLLRRSTRLDYPGRGAPNASLLTNFVADRTTLCRSRGAPTIPDERLPDGSRVTTWRFSYCSAMILSNSTIGLTGTCSPRVTVTSWMVAVHVNGAS